MTPDKMKRVQEVLQLMSVMTGDRRYGEVCGDETEGGPNTMCDVLERIENKGRAEGRAEGREEGREEGRAEGREEGKGEERLNSIRNLMKTMKWTAEQAMDALLIPDSERAVYSRKLFRP